jgi:hypothetical protein
VPLLQQPSIFDINIGKASSSGIHTAEVTFALRFRNFRENKIRTKRTRTPRMQKGTLIKSKTHKQKQSKKQDDVTCQHYATKLLTIFLVPGIQSMPGSTGLAAVCDQGLPERTRWEEVEELAAPAVKSVMTKRFVDLWAPGPRVKYQAATAAAMMTMMSTGKGLVSKEFLGEEVCSQ